MRKLRLSWASDRSKVLLLLGLQAVWGAGRICRKPMHLGIAPTVVAWLCRKWQSGVPFASRPGQPSARGAKAKAVLASHRGAIFALLPHIQMSRWCYWCSLSGTWDPTPGGLWGKGARKEAILGQREEGREDEDSEWHGVAPASGGRGTVFMSVYNLGAYGFVPDLLMNQHSLPAMVLYCHFVQGTVSSLPACGR